MVVRRCFWIDCDTCDIEYSYSYQTLKRYANKEFRKEGWKINKDGTTICVNCQTKQKMLCPRCGSKLIKEGDCLVCKKHCGYWISV